MNRFRWKLADILSWLACKLRGHEWRQLPSNYPGVYGNHPAALKDRADFLIALNRNWDISEPHLEELQQIIGELGQLAGENWGHWPKT